MRQSVGLHLILLTVLLSVANAECLAVCSLMPCPGGLAPQSTAPSSCHHESESEAPPECSHDVLQQLPSEGATSPYLACPLVPIAGAIYTSLLDILPNQVPSAVERFSVPKTRPVSISILKI